MSAKSNYNSIINSKGEKLDLIPLKGEGRFLVQINDSFFTVTQEDLITMPEILHMVRCEINKVEEGLGEVLLEKSNAGEAFVLGMLGTNQSEYSSLDIMLEIGFLTDSEQVQENDEIKSLVHSLNNLINSVYVPEYKIVPIFSSMLIKDGNGEMGEKTLPFICYDEDCEDFNGENEIILPSGTRLLEKNDSTSLYLYNNMIFSKHKINKIIRWSIRYQLAV